MAGAAGLPACAPGGSRGDRRRPGHRGRGGRQGPGDMGKVMGVVKTRLAGKADMGQAPSS